LVGLQVAEHVIEWSVLEHQNDYVFDLRGHFSSPFVALRGTCSGGVHASCRLARGNEMQTDRQFAQDIPESEKRPAKSRRTTKAPSAAHSMLLSTRFGRSHLVKADFTETLAPKGVRLRQRLDGSARLPVAKANGPPKWAVRCGARHDLGGAPSCEAELGESNSKERERRGFG